MTPTPITFDAARVAIDAHRDQMYGIHPYFHHLSQVVRVLQWAGVTDYEVLAAGWLHDVVEDTQVTIETIESCFGDNVANMVSACTGVGHNRKTRNLDIESKLLSPGTLLGAVLVKLADRIANMESSRDEKRGHYKMYLTERDRFIEVCETKIPNGREENTALILLVKRLLEA